MGGGLGAEELKAGGPLVQTCGYEGNLQLESRRSSAMMSQAG
jgi:hypothetical protein